MNKAYDLEVEVSNTITMTKLDDAFYQLLVRGIKLKMFKNCPNVHPLFSKCKKQKVGSVTNSNLGQSATGWALPWNTQELGPRTITYCNHQNESYTITRWKLKHSFSLLVWKIMLFSHEELVITQLNANHWFYAPIYAKWLALGFS